MKTVHFFWSVVTAGPARESDDYCICFSVLRENAAGRMWERDGLVKALTQCISA